MDRGRPRLPRPLQDVHEDGPRRHDCVHEHDPFAMEYQNCLRSYLRQCPHYGHQKKVLHSLDGGTLIPVSHLNLLPT